MGRDNTIQNIQVKNEASIKGNGPLLIWMEKAHREKGQCPWG